MKRRSVNVNNKKTKVQLAVAVVDSKECKVLVFNSLKKLCFKEMNGDNTMNLSLGTFSKQPFKYNFIKRLLVTKLSKNDSEKIVESIEAIAMAEAVVNTTVEEEKEPQQMMVEHETIDVDSDIKKEKECYDHAIKCANKVIGAIESLEADGVPKQYISSRYPDLRADMLNGAAVLSIKWSELNSVIYEKNSIEERIRNLKKQLDEVNYQIYLAKEAYIVAMRDQISHLEDLDTIMEMVEEDRAEINRLNRIKELEAELADLKGKSKFDNSSSKPEHEPKKEEKVPVLDVELATEVQDREIRYLANHLYQVRRGNEEHNPVIYRKIAELSWQMKMTKPEFCKKILSINYNTYDRHHKAFMNSLGLHIYGERSLLRPVDMDPEEVKARVLQWANIHLIPSDTDDNQVVLNKDVYNAFTKETAMEITNLNFYLILKRRGGYVTKTTQNYEVIDGVKKLVSKTFYVGYRLV